MEKMSLAQFERRVMSLVAKNTDYIQNLISFALKSITFISIVITVKMKCEDHE